MTTITAITIFLALTFVVAQETKPTVTFRVVEEEDVGKLIGSVSEDNLDESIKSNLTYILHAYQEKFSLKAGNLYTMVKLDRENVCRYDAVCELGFAVTSYYKTYYYQVEVTVIIDDINDNTPEFTNDPLKLRISEGVKVGQNFSMERAEDDDTGASNGIQSYKIYPESDTFGLRTITNNDVQLKLYVKKSLDRETQSSYKIHVLAKDGGDTVRTGTLTVDIEVTDMNDNPPKFTKPVYNVTVEEDTTASSVILTLSATDLDTPANGNISYSIKREQANVQQILADFSVNEVTGEIELKRQLVYQTDHHYSFTVVAVDNGEPPIFTEAEVLVYVNDAGNNAPEIIFSTLGNSNFVNVPENSPNGTFVAHVSVKDTDSGQNGIVNCSVSNTYFKILSTPSYRVVVNALLDREIRHLYNVTVTCADNGSPSLSSSNSFMVRVTDVNDNKPRFELLNYMTSVFENTLQEEIILQVSATDRDIESNKDLTYNIPNQDKILVNANSGVISVKPYFDRETTPVIIFEVLAIDKGDPPLTGTATVTLTIKDRNDNAPEFLRNYDLEIPENESSGTRVGQFSAVDKDINANGQFTFALSTEKVPFTVLANGVLQSNRELDREERSRYDFHVLVIDQGEPSLSSSAEVTVRVTDINDNKPNITFPMKSNKTVSISYPNREMDFVAQVTAYDLDSGENQTLSYSIVEGNEMGIFTIDENTGRIVIHNNGVNIDHDMRVPLSIEVKDSGKTSLASRSELIVEVVYTNATFAAPSDSDNKYIVISAVVVIVTVLISAAIIGVIFLLRTLDKRRKRIEENNSSDCDCGFDDKPSMFIIDSGESSNESAGTAENGKKKKEVSFSLDDQDSMNSFAHELKVSSLPDPARVPDKPPRSDDGNKSNDLYDKVTTRLESLKLQQMLMETRAKQHQQLQVLPPHDDSRSETSGETADSGRGGSEEDVPTNSVSTDDQKVFEPFNFQTYAIPHKYSTLNNLATQRTRDNYSPAPPPIPCRTYKPSSFTNHSSDSHQYFNEPVYNHGDSAILNSSVSSWQQQYQSPIAAARLDFSNLASLTSHLRDSVKSREDDDCSTTTSAIGNLATFEARVPVCHFCRDMQMFCATGSTILHPPPEAVINHNFRQDSTHQPML